jgi:hypothetical protein
MLQALFLIVFLVLAAGPAAAQQSRDFKPLTDEMLLQPNPEDWLMPSRTYDWQRFSGQLPSLLTARTTSFRRLMLKQERPTSTGTTCFLGAVIDRLIPTVAALYEPAIQQVMTSPAVIDLGYALSRLRFADRRYSSD